MKKRPRGGQRQYAPIAMDHHDAAEPARAGAPARPFAPHVLRLQRDAFEEEDAEPVQADHVTAHASTVQRVAQPVLDRADAPLPHAAAIQAAFGRHDISGVRAEVGGAARDAGTQIGAAGFASGERIGFREEPNLRLAAHETAHVIQQRRGIDVPGGVGARGDVWEQHANAVADTVTAGRSAEPLLDRVPGAGTAPRAGLQLDDDKPKHDLPTGAMLALVLPRLEEVLASGSTVGAMIAKRIKKYVDDALAGTGKDDPATLREKTIRLNDFLVANQSIFGALHAMNKKDSYLPGIADTVTEQIGAVERAYAVALQMTWHDQAIYELAIERADTKMKALPDFIINEYLGPKGLEAEVRKVRPELDKLYELRYQVNRAALRGRTAERIVWMHAPARYKYSASEDLLKRLEFARKDKAKKQDIGNQLKALNLLTQQALGAIHAMQVYEQLDAYVQQLDNWINKGIEIFGKEVLDQMRGYRTQVDDIIKIFEADYEDPEVGERGASSVRVHGALNKLAALINGADFQKNVGAAEDRMKTIAVIKIVGKVIALTALAAMGGAVAAEYAAAAAISLGAAEGGLVAGGAAFIAEVFAFTAISRIGQKQLFGNPETSFGEDLLTNAAMFGVLKVAQAGFTRAFKIFADPKVWKTTHALGKAGAGLVSLQLFAEAHHALTHKGALMSGEDRIRSVIQNVVLVVALEAGRFITEPIVTRLSMPALRVKFTARMDALGKSSEALKLRVESLKRGELKQDEVLQLLKDIEAQWFAELKVLADALQKKVITDAELAAAVAKYQGAIAQLQLQLSRLNIEAPASGGDAMFKPLESGVVEFANTQAALDFLTKYYKDRGGSFEPSKTVPDAFEGRLPTGELTFFMPEGKATKGVPDAAKVAAGRDAANAAAAADPVAATGLERLGEIFGKLRIDEILAAVPAGYVDAFLRILADPALTPGVGKAAGADFFIHVAGSPEAIRFGRRYGVELLLNLYRRSTTMQDLAKVLAEVDARLQADPAGAKTLIDDLTAAKTAEAVDKLLGKSKPKPPKKPVLRVTKKSLPVDRGRPEWTTVREEAKRDAEDHGQTLTDEELDLRADCELFFLDAKNGMFRRRGRETRVKFLDAFDRVAKDSKMPQSWINAHRGILSEALFNPGFGKAKKAFVGGAEVKGKLPKGATIPDYWVSHPTFTEYVNQKSDLIDSGTKTGAVFDSGVAAARRYLGIAKGKGTVTEPGEATNLPAGDRYSLDFVRDPGAATQKAMLDILFATDSPIFRVKFGDGAWHTNPGIK